MPLTIVTAREQARLRNSTIQNMAEQKSRPANTQSQQNGVQKLVAFQINFRITPRSTSGCHWGKQNGPAAQVHVVWSMGSERNEPIAPVVVFSDFLWSSLSLGYRSKSFMASNDLVTAVVMLVSLRRWRSSICQHTSPGKANSVSRLITTECDNQGQHSIVAERSTHITIPVEESF